MATYCRLLVIFYVSQLVMNVNWLHICWQKCLF